MTDLMIGKTNITKLLREGYKKLGNGRINLLTLPTEMHMDVNIESLKILINEMKYNCIYITLSKSFGELDRLFKSKGVNSSNLYFIDAVSNMYGTKQESTKRCIHASGPLDLDSITSSLRQMLSALGSEKKCIFLDSVTTVLLYNSLPRTIRFSQFLTKTLKSMGIDGIMINIAKGETTERLVGVISKLCDEMVDITDGGVGVKKIP